MTIHQSLPKKFKETFTIGFNKPETTQAVLCPSGTCRKGRLQWNDIRWIFNPDQFFTLVGFHPVKRDFLDFHHRSKRQNDWWLQQIHTECWSAQKTLRCQLLRTSPRLNHWTIKMGMCQSLSKETFQYGWLEISRFFAHEKLTCIMYHCINQNFNPKLHRFEPPCLCW